MSTISNVWRMNYFSIPMDSKFGQFRFQGFAKSTVIPRIVTGNAEKFFCEFVVAQDFQHNARHIFTRMMIEQTFESQEFLMKVEVRINPMCSDT